MATTNYAWTNIVFDGETVAKVGKKVTASGLGMDDDQFQELVDAGSVRPYAYPDLGSFTGSPVEHKKAQAAAMMADEGWFDSQYGRVDAPEVEELDKKSGSTTKVEDKK